MTPEEYLQLWAEHDGRCAVSGIEFCESEEGSGSILTRPWRPSLDQASPNKGYAYGNVQIVCQIANFAMSEYDKSAFYTLCAEVVNRKREAGIGR